MSRIIRTVRIAGPVFTLGQAERELRLKASEGDLNGGLDLERIVRERAAALRQELEQHAAARHQEAVQAAAEAAARRLQEVQEQAAVDQQRTAERRFQEGYRQGLDEREAEAREAVERLATLHEALKQERARVLRDGEELVVDLAMAVAERILDAQVDLDRTVVARIIRKTLEHLGEHGNLEVHVHPDDLKLARRLVQRWVERVDRDSVIRVRVSDLVDRGGCMVEGKEQNVDARLCPQLTVLHEALRRRLGHTEVSSEARAAARLQGVEREAAGQDQSRPAGEES